VAGALRLDDQIALHPVRYAHGLAEAIRRAGAEMYEGTRATGLHEGAPCRVRTTGGTVHADHVVIATPYPIFDRGGYFARLEAIRSYCIAARVRGSLPTGMSINAGSPTRSINTHGGLLMSRICSILSQKRLFLVVQDLFRTETAELADVVLPAATWGEKTGTFTNADRTVHLSDKAVEPPGEARADLDIFLDYARRMDFRDKAGQPLPPWEDAESAFEAWKRCSAGRPCDYTGLSYATLRGGSGIQWPCTAEHPEGTERLYADGQFWSAPDYCESYSKDLITGAPLEPTEYRAMNPSGKAVIKAAEYLPPHEPPTEELPFFLITGRTLFHFHTRTKTGRAPQLQAAAPEVWVEMSVKDAKDHGISEGDLVEVGSARGTIRAPVRITSIRDRVMFVPFHYGYWDVSDADGHQRAANELTITDWDPVSKQPIYKTAAVRVSRVAGGNGHAAPAPTNTASRPAIVDVPATHGGPAAHADEQLGITEGRIR
jgi:anaerobic selenocysteine-containing dehydrogenase